MKFRLLVSLFIFLSFHAYSQNCALSLTINSSNEAICSGIPVTLEAVPSGGNNYSYSWNTGETGKSIIVNKAGTYILTVSDNASGCSAVTKQIIISSAAMPDPPTVAGATICANSSATLTATAPGGDYQWYDSPKGGTLLATGNSYTPAPLNSSKTFYVETTLSGCTSTRAPVTISVTPGPQVFGTTVCAGSSATIRAAGGSSYQWFENAEGGNPIANGPSLTIPAVTESRNYYVQAVVNGCLSNLIAVPININPIPDAPTAAGTTICSGSSANLTATAPGGVYRWYNVPTGGTALIVSPDFSTPSLTQTTTYYVETNLNGCTSSRTAVTVNVNPLPEPPVSIGTSICANSTTVLTASGPADSYEWFTAAVGGNLLATGQNFTTPVLFETTTYYVQAKVTGCTGQRTAVTVTVNPIPPNPSAPSVIICSGSNATLTASARKGSFEWYNAQTGGTLVSSDATFMSPVLIESTTYYVQNIVNECISERTAATITVIAGSVEPTVSDQTICLGSKATLSASSSSGVIEWYDSPSGGNLLIRNPVYITPALSTSTTYYLQSNNGSCTSNRTAVTVTVDPVPASPVSSDVDICKGNTATFNASGSGIIEWFADPTGGSPVATGPSFTTPVLNSSKTYYVSNRARSCSSPRIAVKANIPGFVNPAFQYSSGTYCSDAADVTPQNFSSTGGTFSASPAGLSINPLTGNINFSASTPQTYLITFVDNSPCNNVSQSSLTITTNASADFTYNASYCKSDINPKPIFTETSSAGTFSASPAGLTFVNTATGEIDLSSTAPGTYTITNLISASGSCLSAVATFVISVEASPTVNAGPDQTAASDTPVSLNGSISNAISATWSGGTGIFSNNTSLNAIYTPGTGETSASLTLTTNDPPGSCGPQSDNIILTFSPQPGIPVAEGTTVCINNPAILNATSPGGEYQWYDLPSGGTLLGKGSVFISSPLSADTYFYVQTTINGVTSGRKEVFVKVNAFAEAPSAADAEICSGSNAYLLAEGSAGSYQWFDAPAGGNLLSTEPEFETPVLFSSQTYYVQTILNDCVSSRIAVKVTVNQLPEITSSSQTTVCSEESFNYAITSSIVGTTYLWSRTATEGISNDPISDQTSASISESLFNTTSSPIDVVYTIIPYNNDCSGELFNFTVTVNALPLVISETEGIICNREAPNYEIKFNTENTSFSWSRKAVAGISNADISGQKSGIIKENLVNTTKQPIEVTYVIDFRTANCTGAPFNYIVTVNPTSVITSSVFNLICSSEPLNYQINSNIPESTFIWSRPAVTNIENPPIADQTSSIINETLINTGNYIVNVPYTITPYVNGCAGNTFTLNVNVKPQPVVTSINSNSPVCIGSSIQLITQSVPNAVYTWTGPDNFLSNEQNPLIMNAGHNNSGDYFLSLEVNGCTSEPGIINVEVNDFPQAEAGPAQTVCINQNFVQLDGSVTGGTNTGVWTSSGTGTFDPVNNYLDGKYIPSAEDKQNGSVVLTLTSTSSDDCNASISSMIVTFQPVPTVDAGNDQTVCSQDKLIPLAGEVSFAGGGIWSTSGSGTFSSSANNLKASYTPSSADIANGSIILTLSSTGNGSCEVTQDFLTLNFSLPPDVDAGPDQIVIKNIPFTLMPTVSDSGVSYKWSPAINLSSDDIANPVGTANEDITYTLTITDELGCISQDQVFIKVLDALIVNNTFTPNGDGINDLWTINALETYPSVKVNVYNRYGDKVFHSDGYPQAWDGTNNGKAMPTGTYYYIIETGLEGIKYSGSITIIR